MKVRTEKSGIHLITKTLKTFNQIKLIKDLVIKNVYNKFEVNIENLIEFEQILTPNKLFKKTGSYLGSLYGNHQNSIYSIMKRKQNQDQKIKDLSKMVTKLENNKDIMKQIF